MKKTIIILSFIMLIASGLRFYKLGEVPISPDWDEAALGYNAYSILKTGRDEYGTFLPLSIRSFDDYKPPLYVYLTVPAVALFGLSVWSTRFPSAIMGVLAVLGTYFLVKELLKKNKYALLSAFLLAISPWSIQFSRIAFEANIGVTLNIWAVTAFLAGLKRRIFLPVAAVLFALGMYAYHSERIFLPLLIIILVFVYRRELFVKEHTKSLIFSVILGIVVVAPLIPVVFNQTALLRLRGTSSFTDKTTLLARDITKLEADQRVGDRIGQLLDNRRIVFAKTVAAGYLSHFSFKWLFLTGDNQRHHAPDMGLLYLWELPFLLYGIYRVLKYMKGPMRAVLVGWLLIAPLAASPTTGLPHAVRTLVFLPVFGVFTAVGIVDAIRLKRFLSYVVVAGVVLFAVFNFAYYLDMYFIQQNPEISEYWQYGYKDAVAFTQKIKAKYQKVVVSTTLEQSYMFFLFYTKYDPSIYLAGGGTQSGSFEEANNHFDKYEFRKIDWPNERRDGTILFVGDPKDMPHGNVMNYTFLDGKPAIEMADQPNGAQ
ncbi:MAG: glycosyltransferase family 39 protein [Candidatus Gottesmanbacteria bacterium]|nr:glycosyltransferase family 39 protein [Candidatus Gottesmanbacteria bacterium]